MAVISLPTHAMGPFGMPMTPGDGSSGGEGGGTTFGGKAISQSGSTWVYDGPDANSAVDSFTGITWVNSGNSFVASVQTAGTNNQYGIYQFDTTTAYSTQPSDISFNASFLTYNEIADADFSPKSIIFNSDGSKGFFIEDNELFGFDMSTNYDISTATGTGHTKTSLPNLYGPNDVRFNNNGTKMFVSDVTFGTPIVIEYSLNPAYDVTTRSQTASFDPSQAANGGTNIFGIQFNIDGTKMYALGNGGAGGQRYLYEYDLSTAFDLTTISYNNERLDLQTFAGIDLAESFTFNDDFSKLYIADGNDGVLQFDWGTPPGGGGGSGTPDTIDKATGSLGLTTNGATDSQWFEFNGDGTSLFVHNTGSGGLAPAGYLLNQFNLTTPYDLTTASYSNNVYYGSGNDFEGKFAGDGSKFYYDSGTLWQHNLSSAFVPGTDIRASGQADGQGPSGESFCFKNDGTKLYTLAKSNTPNGVIEWDLSTAWDITTNSLQGGAIAGNNLDYSNEMTGASNIEMNSTGTKVYIYTRNSTISGASIAIVEYDMTTPWDINTGTYNGKYLNVGSAGFTSAERISFRLENDNKIFIKGPNSNHSGNDVIYQYTIPNASSGGGSNALTDGWTVKSTFSGMSNERFYSIGDDSNNNFYAAGYDAVDDTILVASYDKDGTYRWSYNAGGTSDRLYDTAVDTNGNMVAVGYSMSTTGGSTPFPALIVKYTSAGNLVWSRALNDSSSHNWLALAVTTDSSDNIYIAGRTQAQSNGNNDLPFVAKLNNAGAVQWVKKYDHGGQQSQPEGIALDSNGDIIVSGRIHEQITGGGYSAGMVFKASGTDGSIIWNKFFDDGEPVNGYHNDQFQNVAITPEDDILTCGWTNKDYAGTYYGIVLKLSGTDGSIVWQRHTNEEDGTKKIAVDSAGKIYTFTDSEVLFVYASDGTLEQEWKITASGSGADAYYIEDVYIDKNDNAVLCGFFYTGGGDPAFPFITKLPATIQAGTTGDFVITAQSKGDSAGGLNPTTFTSYTANTMSGVITNGTSGLTPNSVSATNTGPTTVTGASGGGGGQSQPQGWIATISDEISGYGYPDARFSSLDVDSNDNIYIGGDAGTNNQIVVKMASDGTVTSAASFGGSGATNNHRAIAVASDESVYSAGEAKDIWNRLDGHVFRFTSSLTKSYDNFFGEGSNDEHYDITADDSGNVFAVGEAQSYSAAFAQDPKGYIVKYDSTGGVAKTQISTSFQRSYPQGISSDGTDVYVIAKDQNHMFVAKVNSALNSVTWSKQWGGASAEPRIMDIDTNSSGESAAIMYEANKIRVAKIDSSGNATWRKTWEKASTDHGDAYPGYDFSAGYSIKLLANGSIALLAGYMPWTTQANKKSLYVIVFDSTGTPTVEKEFRLNNASHYLNQVTKSLGELSDGKIVMAVGYYLGSNSAGSGWKNAVFKFDPTDTSTAINGTHGDWDISDITDSTTGADSTSYVSVTANLNGNMSMYFKSGYQGATNGFSSSSATVVEDTLQTLGGGGGSSGASPDMSTLSYSNKSIDVGPNTGSAPKSVWFESDGLTFYVGNDSTNTVYKYTCTTAWDISTASYASSNYNMAGNSVTSLNDIAWKTDASSYYALGNDQGGQTPDKIYQFDIPSGLTLAHTTHSKTGPIANTANNSVDSTPQKLMFNADGSQVYVSGDATDTIYKFNLTTPWDISTIQQWNGADSFQTSQTTNPRGMTFNHDGTKLYRIDGEGTSPVAIDVYTLSTAYDITSVTTDNDTYAINGPGIIRPEGIYVKEDGTGLYIIDGHDTFATSKIYQFDTTPIGGGGGNSPKWFGDRGLLQFNIGSNPWTEITGVVDIATNGNSTYWGDLVGHGNYTGAASDTTIGVWTGSGLSGPMSYMTFATQGNSVSFGDGNTYGDVNSLHNHQSNGTYGMIMGGYQVQSTPQDGIPQGYVEVMQRYTFAQTSTRPTDHGDLRQGGMFYTGGGVADATNSFIMGGATNTVNYSQAIDYVAFATPGNSTQFGNMSVGANYGAGCSDETYGVYALGYTGSHNNVIEYITMATPGNSTDFGDLQQSKRAVGSTNNATRGIFWGGYTGSQYRNNIDVITITTPGNATQFGNLHLNSNSGMYERQGCSGNAS